jgi:enoyl-CoA hydratase/carnithine racemase
MSIPSGTRDDASSCLEIETRVVNRIGLIVLNRPAALNALSHAMLAAMHGALERWRNDPDVLAVVVHSPHPRAFCAGGDIRFLYESFRTGRRDAIDAFFIDEYRLDHAVFRYPKPYVALMHGVVMGGGMGISQGAPQSGGVRVVTESTKIAMPETRIGLFPDVGAGWFLSRTPGALGAYLAVTGETIGAADALHAKLADLYMPDAALAEFVSRIGAPGALTLTDGVQLVSHLRALASGHQVAPAPEASSLARARTWIDRHFSHRRVSEIVASLERERDPAAHEWAQRTVQTLAERSPLSMAASLELVHRAAGRSMAECLRTDLVLTRSAFAQGDVVEGIRARIIDKDNQPAWSARSVTDVTDERVARMFESPWTPDTHPLRDLRD